MSYVVEQGSDENGNWWRRFSNGWVEQGGRFGYGDLAIPLVNTVTFPIEFAELPTILIGGCGVKDAATFEGGIDLESISTTGFSYIGTAYLNHVRRNSFNWEAKGFAA